MESTIVGSEFLAGSKSSKAKKVSGRREESTAHYAFGPSEDDPIIRQRLLTRTTTTRELSTFELPLLKTNAVIDANKREQQNFKELQAELNKQIVQAQKDIEDLKVQLEESKVERQHKEECEAIRRLIAVQPPRSETQKILSELEREISSLESDNTAATRTLELRKKQFALLLHAVDSLQSMLEEEQAVAEQDLGMATSTLASVSEPTAMDVT
ncbi:hypothetical protein O6H91_13G056200 [Diphasiastrum complanatum]|uniref:Uncharacterized protein n=1 Tax=Diphasiastrum complanatum TaxID=34168 RepID=A0ACC2BVL0_DIPCM|nr:hypothetical protein O6H91_13G056200 [Diphasiastrum complanatum]